MKGENKKNDQKTLQGWGPMLVCNHGKANEPRNE